MNLALNNVATADGWTDAATLKAPRSIRLRMRVRNASIFRRFGRGTAGAIDWEDEVMVYAGADDSLDQAHAPFDAVQFRSAVAGKPARVTAEAITGDPSPELL